MATDGIKDDLRVDWVPSFLFETYGDNNETVPPYYVPFTSRQIIGFEKVIEINLLIY